MNANVKRELFWAPRILCILFVLFLSLFSFDVFNKSLSFRETILALLVHLSPACIVAIALSIAWRWEWLGAPLFITLAVLYLVWAWGRFHWVFYLAISGPLFSAGLLFLLNWAYRAQLRAK